MIDDERFKEIRRNVKGIFDEDARRFRRTALRVILLGGFAGVTLFALMWFSLEPLTAKNPWARVGWSLLACVGGTLGGVAVGFAARRTMRR